MSTNINISQRTLRLHLMVKNTEKPQYLQIFVHFGKFHPFCLICGLIDPYMVLNVGYFALIDQITSYYYEFEDKCSTKTY